MTTETPPPAALSRAELLDHARRFCDAFNRDDLDAVMAFFTDDAVYETLEGTCHRGPAAIRAAFEPQFRGEFGELRFLEQDAFADPDAGAVVLRWVCKHDLGAPLARAAKGPLVQIRRRAFGAALGERFGWEGLDVLYFRGPLVRAKHTFGRARLPLLRRELG